MLNFLLRLIALLLTTLVVMTAAAMWLPETLHTLFEGGYFDEILYVAHNGRSFGLQLNDRRTGLTVHVPTPCIGVETPSWSPDGSQIAYVGFCNGSRAIQVIDADGRNARTVAEHLLTLSIDRPTWSPDGKRLAFHGRGGGSSNIYVIELASGDINQLTDDTYSNYNPSWSPDGRYLVYEAYRASADLMIYDFTNDHESVLTDFQGAERLPAWSPDGSLIAYEGFEMGNETAQGAAGIFVIRPDGSGKRLVYPSRNSFLPQWTPDSRILYFRHTAGTNEAIYGFEVFSAGEPALTMLRDYQPFYDVRP